MGNKAIARVLVDGVIKIEAGKAHYDCDYRMFKPLVNQLNEMGAPVTIEDLIDLIEEKLSGKKISRASEQHLVYTFIATDKK